MTSCPACGASNDVAAKFCGECGTPLAVACQSCGTSNTPGRKFCLECGASLAASSAPAVPTVAAERRLVSVLFIDLVGFTAASEHRDAEDTRELLTRYFDLARTTIERYGGTVEKFIGDAVMAVWGAPVAKEDDAERAVRAALDLVGAVSGLADNLAARAGVLTGEAAVTVGARDQAMVAGDLVNTASRVQSVATPGAVLVGDSTKQASDAGIAYDDAGLHQLKGKAEPVHLWRAMRVVGSVKGVVRSATLEAPFVGRDRELRAVKDTFHACVDERRAHLTLISGFAGIGKSRLAWEFEKYVDGLAADVYWHRGRCLSYGDGVAYWALADMVRMRCDIVEDEPAETARGKLRSTLQTVLPDPEERSWVEPRLAQLLGLEDGVAGDQENLFPAWRTLFERLAEHWPTVLVFEDLQWADDGLLAFIDYLLDWGRGHPLFVLALARPELVDRRAEWAAVRRGCTSLYLDPLSTAAMDQLLTGLVPGLPDELRARVLERAEGVPLYAVETVRMLLNRGVLAREGNVYRATGPIGILDVPDTLHALVAARLDALSATERRLVECAAVLGKTFTRAGLAAVSGVADGELDLILSGLLTKEILSVQADPRSPERGQYGFLQDIVRRVAYDTVSRRARKLMHVAAADFLSDSRSSDEDEIAEVVATHYLDAYASAPDDADAATLKARGTETLIRAADRAASLGATVQAQRAYERAADLSDDVGARAELHERAGVVAWVGAREDDAERNFDRAIELFESVADSNSAARVGARVAEISWERGRIEDGLARMDLAFETLSREEPSADLAELAAQLGRFLLFAGQHDLALDRVERGLEIAEMLALPEVTAQALNTKGILLCAAGRTVEGIALVGKSLELALDNDKPSAALRAYYNLADMLSSVSRFREAESLVADGLVLARRVGSRYWEWSFLCHAYSSYAVGRWDDIVKVQEQLLPDGEWKGVRLAFATLLTSLVPTFLNRGQLADAEAYLALFSELETSADVQERSQLHAALAHLRLARGDAQGALAAATVAFECRDSLGARYEAVCEAFAVAVESALALTDTARAEQLLTTVESMPPGHVSPLLRAHCQRFRARIAAAVGEVETAEPLYAAAVEQFRAMEFTFGLAVTLLEQAEVAARVDAASRDACIGEATDIFTALGAFPWLDRVASLRERLPTQTEPVASSDAVALP